LRLTLVTIGERHNSHFALSADVLLVALVNVFVLFLAADPSLISFHDLAFAAERRLSRRCHCLPDSMAHEP
jgi:hypothetical protein